MNLKPLLLSATLLAVVLPAAAQQVGPDDLQFTTVKEAPVTSIKNQHRSGTCWCFSALSFLESEVIKAKNLKEADYPDFSEMFVVHNGYHDRVIKYVRLDGKMNLAAGSDFGDVLEVVRDYGLMPQEAYSGMNYGYDLPVQAELDAALHGYADAILKNPNRKLTPTWVKGFDGILDAYLGEIPESFQYKGKSYTPASYRDEMGVNPDEYVGFTSYTHHPFYTQFAIEVEDNWRWTQSWNVPIDEFVAIIDYAVDNGYTVLWGGDVSEKGFSRNNGTALLLVDEALDTRGSDQERWTGRNRQENAPKSIKEAVVTQETRQESFDNKTSTDDHGMHLYGIAKDQFGGKFYLIKNSWGEAGKYKGIWYMSEAFLREKTLNIVVNRNAIPKDIKKKIGIK